MIPIALILQSNVVCYFLVTSILSSRTFRNGPFLYIISCSKNTKKKKINKTKSCNLCLAQNFLSQIRSRQYTAL